MMITAHKKNHRKHIPQATKAEIAAQALSGKQTVASISQAYNCSRTTVYKQQDKAQKAIDKAFSEKGDEKVLFYIPVTKSFIYLIVVALSLICNASYRGIIFFLKAIFGYKISLGNVHNILDNAADKAAAINDSYPLDAIRNSAADELFHRAKPILATVDIDSRFCSLLVKAIDRDANTWGIHLFDLKDKGYAPDVAILDGAKGLQAGHEIALPDTVIRHDHFHFIQDLEDCARFLTNRIASATTAAIKLFSRSQKVKTEEKKEELTQAFNIAMTELDALNATSKIFKTLSSWLQHDVLQLAGKPPKERSMLYDFIVEEMTSLAEKHPHRIGDILISLNTRREALLDVSNTLNEKFSELAQVHNLSIDTIWTFCDLARYSIDSCNYVEKADNLVVVLGNKFDEIEDSVLWILENTHRCSSMVENFNSRLRPYLDKRRFISQKRLGLLQFFLNHKPFMRSKHKRLVNKSPAQALTGKEHLPLFEMLGFSGYQIAA